MSREIVIAWVGRRRPDWDQLCAHYQSRIGRMAPVRELVLKPGRGPDAVRIEQEGKALLDALPPRSFLVALDRRGETPSSVDFARRLAELRREWPHSLVFAVGSDLGLSRVVLERAQWRCSLGRLTLPHELARLVLCEQIYRALAIEQGIKYHRVPLDGH